MNRSILFRRLASVVTLLFVALLFGTRSVAQSAPSISGFRLPFEGGPFSIVQGPSCPQYSHLAVPEAIDFVMPEGTHLVAVQSGTVVFVGWDGNYGNQVRVTHDNGLTSWYNHIQPNGFQVSVGDRVNQGQVVALSGTTGKSDLPHLHFEVREGGTQVAIDTLPGISWDSGSHCTGSATGGPAATSNKKPPLNNCFTWLNDTRIDCFVRGTDNRMYQRYWNGGGWSEFDLGGTLASAPTCFPWLNESQIHCFAQGTDNRMYQRFWNGGAWSVWIDLGGTLASAPACFPWLNGSQIHCFARGTDNRMYQRFWNGGWSDWIDLGGTLASAPTCSPWFNGSQIHCFARGTDNRMYQRFWNGGWSDWIDLGGTLASAPTCFPWLNESQVHCFARGTDNRMYQRFWNGGAWSDWIDLGGTLASAPTCFPWLNESQVHCFARGTDNRMYQRFWNGGWSDWIDLGGTLASAPTCFPWLNDTRIDCFAQGTDNSLQQRYWNGLWSNWINLGGSVNLTIVDTSPQVTLSPLQVTRGAQQNESGSGFTPNGPLHMSIRLPDGTYYEQALQADANGRFATPYTMPMNAQIGHYAYRIQDLTTGIWSNTVEYDVLASTPPVTPTTATRTATTATAIPPTATTMTPTPTAATLTPTPTASATTGSVLALVPAATTLSVGGTLAVAVEVRSGTQPIDGAAVYLDFDPAVLEVVSVIPSASLPISLTQKSDPIGGHLDLIRGAISSLPQGTFSLATVTFRARIAAPTGTSLSISRTTARPSDVSFGGISKLGQTIPATLTIRDGSMITVDVPFEGRPQAPSVRLSVPLSVTLTLAGATTPAYQAMLTTDQYGRFPLVGIVPGTYTLSVKHPQSLRVQITAVITSGTATLSLGLLPSGDANNDNQINLLDFSLLSGTFGKSSSTTGYDSRADFNNDNIINLLDFSLLAKNFGKAGLASSPLALTTVNTPQVVAQVVRDLRAGETFALDLAVNAPMTGIDGAAAYLNFDPTLLEVATITGDPTLDLSLQQEIDNPNGQVALVRGTLTSPLPTGRVNLGRITFRARTQATAAVITLVDDGGLRQSAVTANGRTLAQTDAPWQLTATTAGYSVYLPLVVR